MRDVESLSSMMTSIQLNRMIGQPGTERRLRFSEVDIQGRAEETTVKWKDIITKLIELGNGLDCLTSSFTFMNGIVGTMTSCILKCPNGKDGVEKMVKNREKAGFVKHLYMASRSEVGIL